MGKFCAIEFLRQSATACRSALLHAGRRGHRQDPAAARRGPRTSGRGPKGHRLQHHEVVSVWRAGRLHALPGYRSMSALKNIFRGKILVAAPPAACPRLRNTGRVAMVADFRKTDFRDRRAPDPKRWSPWTSKGQTVTRARGHLDQCGAAMESRHSKVQSSGGTPEPWWDGRSDRGRIVGLIEIERAGAGRRVSAHACDGRAFGFPLPRTDRLGKAPARA